MSDVPGGPTPPPLPPLPPLPPPPPPPMMGGPQGGIPPKTLGEILSATFSIYRANASKLLFIVAIVVVPLSFISTLFSSLVFAGTRRTEDVFGRRIEVTERSFGLFLAGALVTLAISVIISAVLQAAILRAAAQATIGDPVDPESYRFGFKRLGSVILVSLLVGLAVIGGLIILIIPGIVFFVFLSVAVPVLIVENRRGTAAMGRSWNLVKGHFWHAFGVFLVLAIISGVVSGIIGAIGGDQWVVRWIFTSIGTTITAPFSALVSVLLYLDLRSRSEAISADTLRTELAAAGSSG